MCVVIDEVREARRVDRVRELDSYSSSKLYFFLINKRGSYRACFTLSILAEAARINTYHAGFHRVQENL